MRSSFSVFKIFLRSGRPLLLGFAALALILASIPNAVGKAAPSDLDPTFGIAGKVITPFPSSPASAQALAIQSDGKIIAAGTDSVAFALVRYNSDGSLDSSFGNNGEAFTYFSFDSVINAVAIQPDGKIVAAGHARSNSGNFPLGVALARYNRDGSLDTAFGNNGTVFTVVNDKQSEARALAIQPDGKIILAGSALDNNQFTFDFVIARYNSDGSPDVTFASGGKLIVDQVRGNGANAVVIQSDGRIVIAGNTFNSIVGGEFALLRCNSDGSFDTTFGDNGIVITDFTNRPQTEPNALALQPDGKIIAAGVSGDGGLVFRDFALAHYNTNGALDLTFGNGGKVTTDLSGGGDTAYAVAIQPNGKIIAAGAANRSLSSGDFGVARYNPNGSLDPSFGTGGKIIVDFLGDVDEAHAVAIQTDAKIVVAGLTKIPNTDFQTEFVLARLDGGESFDLCIQDDSNSNLLQINTTTGGYQFTNCSGLMVGGIGTITRTGNVVTLQQGAGNHRLIAKIDGSSKKATATLQILSTGRIYSILDRNTTNNTCGCK